MGCATSLGLDIVLTDALLPSLKSCKYLPLSQVNLLLDSLKKQSGRSIIAHPDQVQPVLSKLTNDAAELCNVFSMKIGSLSEKFVNIYYLVSSLAVHSYASWESKVRFIYNLYVNFETLSIGIEEMKLLVQSVVKGVYLSTGRKLPDNRIFCELAIEVFNQANVRRDMRVDVEELIKYVSLEPEILTALRNRHFVHEKADAEVFKPIPHPLLRTHRKTDTLHDLSRSKICCKSMGDLNFVIRTRARKFPSIITQAVNESVSKNKVELIKKVYSKLHESKTIVSEKDIIDFMKRNSLCNPQLFSFKKWSKDSLSCEEAISKLRPFFKYLNTRTQNTQDRQVRRKQRLSTGEMKTYAEIYHKGDSEKKGWDKVDIFDNIGPRSTRSAYYLIEKFKVSSNRRLRFSDYLQVSLPDNVEVNEERVNRYYQDRIKTAGIKESVYK